MWEFGFCSVELHCSCKSHNQPCSTKTIISQSKIKWFLEFSSDWKNKTNTRMRICTETSWVQLATKRISLENSFRGICISKINTFWTISSLFRRRVNQLEIFTQIHFAAVDANAATYSRAQSFSYVANWKYFDLSSFFEFFISFILSRHHRM